MVSKWRKHESEIEPITVSATRRVESLTPDPGFDDNTSLNNGLDFVTGPGAYVGDSLHRSGLERERLVGEVARLHPDAKVSREILKEDSRHKTPALVRGVIQEIRPSTKALPGTGQTANRTNADWDRLGKVFKHVGRGTLGVSAISGVKRIMDAENKARELSGVAGSVLGGVGGGGLGATLGASMLNPATSVLGGVAGSIAGSELGEELGYDLYDWYGRL